jgi:AcrR family transcriptional regulator
MSCQQHDDQRQILDVRIGSELADATGIVAPSLYNAFTSKQALFEEAVEVYAQRYGGYIQESDRR